MRVAAEECKTGLEAWRRTAAFLFSCLVLFSRHPEALLHPQFWAEDGHVWYADAYNQGWWRPLFHTQDGYFQTLPRLGAALSLLVPLTAAPLTMNLLAVLAQALPVLLLLGPRSQTWGSLKMRAVLAAVYLALPNCWEMQAILTSTQWILALCVFLTLAGRPATSRVERLFDLALYTISGLTGPFCFFLLLVALVFAWRRHEGRLWRDTGFLAIFCLIQGAALLLLDHAGRAHAPLGASLSLLLRILGGQVYLPVIFGYNGLAGFSNPNIGLFLIGVALAGTTLLAIYVRRAGLEMQVLIGFAFLILAASLLTPAVYPPPGNTRWRLLAATPGIRYWFFPNLAFAWSIVYLTARKQQLAKIVGGYLLFFLCIAVMRDWRFPIFEEQRLDLAQQRLEAAQPGETVLLPDSPRGWTIRLIKRDAHR